MARSMRSRRSVPGASGSSGNAFFHVKQMPEIRRREKDKKPVENPPGSMSREQLWDKKNLLTSQLDEVHSLMIAARRTTPDLLEQEGKLNHRLTEVISEIRRRK